MEYKRKGNLVIWENISEVRKRSGIVSRRFMNLHLEKKNLQ